MIERMKKYIQGQKDKTSGFGPAIMLVLAYLLFMPLQGLEAAVCSAYPQDEARAQLCKKSGMIYNCHARACVTSSNNANLNKCFNEAGWTIQILEDCDKNLNSMITKIQTDPCPNIAEAQACKAKGHVWNCAAQACLLPEQDSELNSKLNQCKSKANFSEKQNCAQGHQARVEEMIEEYNRINATPTPTPTPTATPSATPTPTPTGTATPTPTATVTPTVSPTVTPTVIPTLTPTVIPTSTPEPTPTPTPTPIACDQTPIALECKSAGKFWNCERNSCLQLGQHLLLTKAKATCNSKITSSEREACLEDLSKSSVKDVTAGKFCSPTEPEAQACHQNPDKFYNCNIPQCLYKKQNQDLSTSLDACYALSGQASADCISNIKRQAIEEEAAGLYCPDSADKTRCRTQGLVWNCNVGQCLPNDYNTQFAKNSATCYEEETQEATDSCITLLKDQTVRDLASGNLCAISDEKLACESSTGMVYNCQINQCIPKVYNESLSDQAVECYRLPTQGEQQACMDELELKTVRDLASGKICSSNIEKKTCGSGEVFNCKLNMCLSSSYNDDFTNKAVACYQKETKREQDSCMAALENQTIVDVASGAACSPSPANENACASEGKLWNCQIGLCVTSEYNQTFTSRVAACYRQQDQIQREKCLQNVEDATMLEIAKGALCTSDSDKTKARECAAESKVWNCNANLCLTAAYNDTFAQSAVKCYDTGLTSAQKETCLTELKRKTAVEIASGAMCTPKKGITCGAGTVYNCLVEQCLPEDYNATFAQRAADCEMMEDEAAKNKCKDDLKSKTMRDLASGEACAETDKKNECQAVGLVWNCNVGRCLSTSFNDDFTNSAVACYEKKTTTEQDSCIQTLRLDTIEKLAKGTDCAEAKTAVCGVGEVYNCNVGMCINSSYNDKIAEQATTCYQKESNSEQQACLDQLEKTTIREIASGAACADAAKSEECSNKNGQVWNCNIKMCVPPSYNEQLADQTVKCYEKQGDARDKCLAEVESDVKRDVASGKLCIEPAKQAACKGESKVYNCHVDSCLTSGYNDELSNKVLSCIGSASEDACLAQLKKETIFDLASGKDCGQSAKTAECSEKGMVWNCQVGQCLTREYNEVFANGAVGCYEDKTEDETLQCKEALKRTTIKDIAKGVLCDNSGNENAQKCESSGKNWNCNANLCFDDKQNEIFAEEATICELHTDSALKKRCQDQLKDKTLYIAANSCDTTGNEEATACNAKPGKIWNCLANMCLFKDDNVALVDMVKKCQAKPTKAEQDECMEEVAIIVGSPEEIDKQIKPEMFEFEDKASGMYMATAGLPVLAWGGLTALGKPGICASSALNIAASAYAAVTIANAADEADEKLKKLKEEYDMYQKLKEEEGFRIENQIRTLKFYMRALKTAEQIAEDMSAQFATNSYMFMGAAVVAAIEGMMFWDGARMACGLTNAAIAGVGAALSMMAKGKADKTADDMRAQQKKLQEIIDVYERQYGGPGANTIDDDVGDSSANPNLADDSNTGQVQTIGAQKLNNAKLSTDLLDQNGSEITSTESKPGRNCADQNGKLDKDCQCRETKTCFQIDPKKLNFGPSTNSINEAIGLTDSLNDANKVMRGELSGSEISKSAIASRLSKSTKVKEDLTAKLNKELAARGKTPINVNDQFVKNYVAKNVPPSAFNSPTARRLGDLLSDTPVSNYAPKEKELSDKLREAGILTASTANPTFIGPNKKSHGLDEGLFGDETDNLMGANGDDQNALSGDSAASDAFDYSDGQIVKKSDVSIFQQLSHRYKVLRANGRFTLKDRSKEVQEKLKKLRN